MMVRPSTAVSRAHARRAQLRRSGNVCAFTQSSHVARAAQERNQVMRSQNQSEKSPSGATAPRQAVTRRSVLKGSTAAMGAAATFAALGTNFAWAQVSEEIKVGMIGAGGRASGAAGNILEAGGIIKQGVKIHAVADAFPDPVKKIKDKYKVDQKNCFVGLDAYKELVNSDIELVITATPPGFRPLHFAAAIEAGKHIFFEKPVAVDPWGVRMVIAAGKKAAEKKLAAVTGTQRRHQTNYNQAIEQIHAGAIGDIMHMSVYWNGQDIWFRPRKEGMTDMQAQVHNWYHHIWLSGDQICEQHIHNLDIANWVMNSHPISALGLGGRQVRDAMGQKPGEIWDHFGVEYEYPNGARVMSQCRHWPKSDSNVSEFAIGSKGTFSGNDGTTSLTIGGQTKRFKSERSGYVQEHIDMINSIKAGKPLNEATRIAESTLTSIIGRMSAYTGKKVMWDWAMNESKLQTMPNEGKLTWETKPPEVMVPQPGVTALI
jgi:predicted dehydrogenase